MNTTLATLPQELVEGWQVMLRGLSDDQLSGLTSLAIKEKDRREGKKVEDDRKGILKSDVRERLAEESSLIAGQSVLIPPDPS